MAGELSAFVVPGEEIARAGGLDLRAAGLTVASTPRHANVLAVVGELPEGLAGAATVAYAQMPRPRAVLAVGSSEASLLTGPDVSVARDQGSLETGVAELRRRFARGAFDPQAEDFEAAALRSEIEYACPMHPEVVQDEPGTCPKCGMELVAQEAEGGGHDHGEHDHEQGSEASGEEEESEGGVPDHEGHGGHGPGSDNHEEQEHGGHEHDHGDMEFMSMVEMTQGTPRGSDGLQMEWVETPFGPLFPGLPGGLALSFTLGGDTVEKAEAGSVAGIRESLEGPVDSLAERLARLDPLSPVSYRILARRALEAAAGAQISEEAALSRVAALERERAASHLGWIAGFGHVIGYAWLAGRAGELQLALLAGGEVSGLREAARRLTRRVERTLLLRRRLAGVGRLDASDATGPVARSSGLAADTRAGEETYRSLGFEPVTREEGDALARLRLRLAEIRQSLDLAEAAGVSEPGAAFGGPPLAEVVSGAGTATVETPRGTATLSVEVEDGEIVSFELRTPSETHLRLVQDVTLQRELGDALVGVASLDLSPWGLTSEWSA